MCPEIFLKNQTKRKCTVIKDELWSPGSIGLRLTSMLFPRRLYICCIRFSDDGATGGGLALFTAETLTYAASHGVEQAPVSPTCSTSCGYSTVRPSCGDHLFRNEYRIWRK